MTDAEIKFRAKQRERGLSHVRVWVPSEYAAWIKHAAVMLRVAKKSKGKVEPRVPELFSAPDA